MPTFTMTKNWDDGQTLTENMLDDIKTSVETFLNTTKLDSDNIQTGGISNDNLAGNITTDKLDNALTAFFVPTGGCVEYAGSSIPTGWLECNGQAVDRVVYAALFNAIGETYGAGDSATTFNVPDRRGRVGVGAGTGSGLTARSRGDSFGAETLPAHDHSVSISGNTGSTSVQHSHYIGADGNGGAGTAVTNGNENTVGYLTAATYDIVTTGSSDPNSANAGISSYPRESTAHTHSYTVSGNTGSTGTGSHGVMQPSLVFKYIIKT